MRLQRRVGALVLTWALSPLGAGCDSAGPLEAADCDCPGAQEEVYEWAEEPVDFALAESSEYSTAGEDGLIQKLFEIIEPTTKYVVEFGAGDGVRGSNSYRLIEQEGWRSLQIEGDPGRAAKMRKNLREFSGVTALEAWVWPGNIEILFEENGVPRDFDLLVIDIDSNDYYVWRAIHEFRPKAVLIEVHAGFPPPEKMVIDFHPMNYWDFTGYYGASLQSLYDLGKKKGYELVYHMSHGGNALFVDAKYFPLFGIRDNSPEKLFSTPPEAVQPLLKQGGKPHLIWKNLEIEKKLLHHR